MAQGLCSYMSVLPLAVQAVVVGLAGAVVYHVFFKFLLELWNLRHFDGPVPMPLVGNLYDKAAFSFIGWLSRLRRQHGKIFRIFTMTRPYVVIMDKVAAREVLSNTKIFPKSPDYPNKFGEVFGDGLVTSGGHKHKADRALFQKYFTPDKVKASLPDFVQQTLTHIEHTIEKHVSEKPGVPYNLEEFFPEVALRMFTRYCINHEFENSVELSEQVSFGSNAIGEHIVLGIPVTMLLPRVRKMVRDKVTFCRQLAPLVDERSAAIERGEEVRDDSLTAMIQKNMSREQMYSHLITMLAAGHDTTAYACCYCLYLLAKHPEAQQRLKREVKRVLGDRTDITPEDYEKLSYARNCFQETLRLYSVVPHVTRLCTEETKLCGAEVTATIPAGVEVLVPICLLNRDVDEWGTPVDHFNPDRFENITRECPKKGYFPFGYSTRSCIGATVALVEGTVLVSLLAQRYTFKEDPNFKLGLKSGITMVATNGVNVIVERDTEYATMRVNGNR